MITFDSYVFPDTVKEVRSKPKRKRIPSASPVGIYFSSAPKPATPTGKIPAKLVVLGTFVLGILTTLYFVQPDQPAQVTQAPEPLAPAPSTAPVAPQTAAAEVVDQPPDVAQPRDVVTADTADLERAVSASLEQDVTRQNSADLIAPVGGMSQTGLTPLSLAEILLGLTPKRTSDDLSNAALAAQENQYFLNRDILSTLRASVLAGEYTVKTVKRNGVKRLCLRMPTGNVTQDQAADLLREAAQRGEIELPESLSTSDGNFDADTLIFNLVQTSLANDGTEAGAQAAKEMSRRAFVASNARTDTVAGERVYIVRPGDSLAYLSLQFYGQPSAYAKIFEANRKILRSPDYIQVGQRLIIPG